jgi:hypothetical protein
MATKSDAELAEFSRHLLYDVQLFFHEGRALMRARLNLGPQLVWEIEMALVESFALHARSLVDFFFRDKGRADDAFAAHYFEPGAWAALRPEPGPWIHEVRHPDLDRFGKEIAHLNYHRVTLAERAKGWPIAQIAGAVGAVLRLFIEHVSARRVVAEFNEQAWREIPVYSRVRSSSAGIAPFWPQTTATRPHGR